MDVFWIIALISLVVFTIKFLMNTSEKNLKQLIGIYIGWAFINLVLLVSSDKDESDFFPFDNARIDSYDYGEFFVYVFGPLVYIYVRSWMKS